MRNLFLVTISLITISVFFTSCLQNQNKKVSNISIKEVQRGFVTPPDSVKPSVYWYWLNDHISKDGVVKDLEAMAQKGIGRAFIGNIALEDSEYGEVNLLSEEWLELTQLAIRKATNLGINIGLFNSPGWSQSGGPWIKPNQSMRYLSYREIQLNGPKKISKKLPGTQENFEDVSLLAFKNPDNSPKSFSQDGKSVTTQPEIGEASNIVDDDTASVVLFPASLTPKDKVVIDVNLDRPFIARTLTLHPAHTNFKTSVELQYKERGKFKEVKSFEFDQRSSRAMLSFNSFNPAVISFPAIKSKHYRLVFDNITGRLGVSEVSFSSVPSVERYIEKQLAKMHQTPLPLWGSYQWPRQTELKNDSLTVKTRDVINISDKLTAGGILKWNIPPGDWTIVRFGMVPTGITNHPASPSGKGLEVDKLSSEPLKNHFNAFVGKVFQSMPEQERKSLKWVVADSYETGAQNWTDGFAEVFEKEFGYNPIPWLPVLTGQVVGGVDQSNRFLWDLRRLIADRIAHQYVGGLRDISNKHGLKLWLENYGHWGFPAEFLQYGGQADEVAGEFWAEGDLGSIENKAASSAAHVYGINKVAAESFTAGGRHFARYPAELKKRGDWSFTEGINHTLLHVYIMQPYEDRDPGMNAWFGTEFNRKNIWFDQIDLFTDYLRRCMFMLQQGQPVVDVAYFIGEGAPKMTGIEEPELPKGYSYDYINSEAIKNRLSVKDGKLTLPEGISYDLLVLPNLETMRPELLSKIQELVDGGAAVLGPPPERSPSLENFPKADKKIQQMAEELWGGVDKGKQMITEYGQGFVMKDLDIQNALDRLNVIPDFKLSSDHPVLYTHRTMGDSDIYFITNQSAKHIDFTPSFRVSGKDPELWNPVTGKIRNLPNYTDEQTHTRVPMKLAPYQSFFIVFDKPSESSSDSSEIANFPKPELVDQVKGPWEVEFDSTRQGPKEPVVFHNLSDWSTHSNKAIKYYSGSAEYSTTFDAPNLRPNEKLFLDLGEVKVMAKVKINGKNVGGAWTAPWRVDISNSIQNGSNQLEVKVANTWVNRLIGDSKLSEKERNTWTVVNNYAPDDTLQSAGLIGPVTLQKIQYDKIVTE